MTMQDPIADMMTRIRNAQQSLKPTVEMPAAQQKCAIAAVLKEEGYIQGYEVVNAEGQSTLVITLKYHDGKPVIAMLKRVSRPGLRVYQKTRKLPKVFDGMGIAIVSTSKGIMSSRTAAKQGLGGEIIGTVY